MPTNKGSFKIFSLAGIDVYVHWSWFLAFWYLTVQLMQNHGYSNYG